MTSQHGSEREARVALLTTESTDDPPQSGIALLDLVVLFWQRRRLIVVVAGMAALVSLGVSLLLPRSYTARTTIMPPQQAQSAASAMLGQLGALSGLVGKDLGIKNPGEIYVALLRSRTIADSIVTQFDLMKLYNKKKLSETRKALESHGDITLSKEGIIVITFEDHNATRAAQIANAYVEQLHKLNESLAITTAGQRRVYFQHLVEQEKGELAQAESALKTTQERTGLIQLTDQARMMIDSVARVRAQIAAKQVEVQRIRLFATDENPQLQSLQEELAALRQQLSVLERPGSQSDPLQIPTMKVPSLGLEYMQRLRDLKYHEALFEFLSRQYEAARIDEASSGTVIQVIDPAIEPDSPSGPKRIAIIVITTLLSVIFVMVYLASAEAARRAQSTPEIAERMKFLRNRLTS